MGPGAAGITTELQPAHELLAVYWTCTGPIAVGRLSASIIEPSSPAPPSPMSSSSPSCVPKPNRPQPARATSTHGSNRTCLAYRVAASACDYATFVQSVTRAPGALTPAPRSALASRSEEH